MQFKCLGGSQWKPEVTRAYDPGSFFVSLSLSLFYFLIINCIPPGSSPLKDPNNNEWKHPHHLHLHHPLTHTTGARCWSLWLHDKLQATLMHSSQTVGNLFWAQRCEMSSGLSSHIWEDEPGAFHPYLMIVCKILSFTWTVCT